MITTSNIFLFPDGNTGSLVEYDTSYAVGMVNIPTSTTFPRKDGELLESGNWQVALSTLEHSDIAKSSFGTAEAVSSYEQADQAGGEGGIGETGDDQLFVDIETKLRAFCQDQERIGMAIATEDGI